MPVPVSAQSKALFCSCLLARIAGSNPAGFGGAWMSVASVVFCEVEVSASG